MIALWVALLVLAVLGVNALIWIPIVFWFRRKKRALYLSLPEEVLAAGETISLGPESALYRGATAGYSQVSGNGVIVLSDRRLSFRKLTGGRIEVPIDRISGMREAKSFLGSYRAGSPALVLQLRDGGEVGFSFSDQDCWMSALRELIRQ